MMKSKLLPFLVLAGAFAFPAGAADFTAGAEGSAVKRENGDFAFLPAAYFLTAVNYFPSRETSFFLDAAGRESWDSREEKRYYDFSLDGKTSFRKDRFFFGLDAASRAFDTYDEAREARFDIGGNFAYNGVDFSVFLKPSFAYALKDVDYYELGIEPGASGLLASFVYTLSLRISYTDYSDGSAEFSLAPGMLLDWYPDVPISLSFTTEYSRVLASGGDLLTEEYLGEAGLLWQPAAGLSLRGRASAEAVFYRDADAREYTLSSEAEFRLKFSEGALEDFSVFLAAGREFYNYGGDSWASSWFVRIGAEKEF